MHSVAMSGSERLSWSSTTHDEEISWLGSCNDEKIVSVPEDGGSIVADVFPTNCEMCKSILEGPRIPVSD